MDTNIKEKVNDAVDVSDATSIDLKKATELVDKDESIGANYQIKVASFCELK